MKKSCLTALVWLAMVATLGVIGIHTVRANVIQLDLASALNYDAVGETGEKQYATWFRTHDPDTGLVRSNTQSTAYDIFRSTIPHHGLGQYENLGQTFVSQAQSDVVSTGRIGLPSNYLISTSYGNFEIGKGMSVASGYTRYGITSWTDPGAYPVGPGTSAGPSPTKQTLYVNRSTQIITLTGGQQGKYNSFNLLFNGWRSATAGTYSTKVEALYAEDLGMYTTVWQDVRTVAANTAGGTLATMNATGANEGTWQDTDGVDVNTFGTDGFQTVTPVAAYRATRGAVNVGNIPFDWGNGGGGYLWMVDTDELVDGNQGLNLDPTKTLNGFRITTDGGTSNRLYVYGISADVVPEPATMSLLALGLGAVFMRRRRSR